MNGVGASASFEVYRSYFAEVQPDGKWKAVITVSFSVLWANAKVDSTEINCAYPALFDTELKALNAAQEAVENLRYVGDDE